MTLCTNVRCNGTDFLCGKCRRQYPGLASSLDDKKRAARSSGNGRSGGGRSRNSNRSFPANNGTVGGRSGYVQRSGERTVAYSGPDNQGKLVSNDGVNADYIRDDDGRTVLDSQSPDPYNPQPWRRH